MRQTSSMNKKSKKSAVYTAINIEQFVADLNSIAIQAGMGDGSIEIVSRAMNAIIKDALLKRNIQPKEKRELVIKYLEVWYSNPFFKNISANLRGANLSGAFLAGLDLPWVDLSGANLSSANLLKITLLGADLSGVNFCRTFLEEADLRWADMAMANVTRTSLVATNLTGANLIGTNLESASLAGADMTDAIILIRHPNLTDEQKLKAICSSEQLADTVNSALDMQDAQITKDKIKIIPNLYKSAKYVGENDITKDYFKDISQALYQRFPFLSLSGKLQSVAKSHLKGEGGEKSNFLVITTFLQGAEQVGHILNKLTADLQTKIISEIIAGTSYVAEEPDEIHTRIAKILIHQSSGRLFSVAEATRPENLASASERSILNRILAEHMADDVEKGRP